MDVEVGDQGCRERNWRPADTCSVLVVQTLAVYLKYIHLQWTVTLLSDSLHTNDANTLWMSMVGLAMIPPCPGVTGRSYSLKGGQEIISFINLLSPNKTKNVNKSITK